MDIISEILEADRLAEEKLSKAKQRQGEIDKECIMQIERIKSETDEIIDEYRCQKTQRVQRKTQEKTQQLKMSEEEKIKGLEKLYRKNHEQWEKEILDAVLER